MKHKLQRTMAMIIAISIGSVVMAQSYDFTDICSTGQTLKYIINGDSSTVTLTGKANGNVVIPDSVFHNGQWYKVTAIGEGAMSECSLTSITIPNTVKTIGSNSFWRNKLTSITIPNSVDSIGRYVFVNSDDLLNITIGDSLSHMGDLVFWLCPKIESITVSANNINFDSRNNCNAIINTVTNTLIFGCKNSTIPNNITSIGSYAFSECIDLASIAIPSSVTSIGERAFYGCRYVNYINVPNSVVSIGAHAFDDVLMIYYNGTATGRPWGALCINGYIEDSLYYKNSSKDTLTGAIKTITTAVIPSTVTTIGRAAFSECRDLTQVTIPNTITQIPKMAFNHCVSLESVNIPNSVTFIGQESFSGCNSLTNIIIPDAVTTIEYCAFSYCSNLSSATIGKSVTDLGKWAFIACPITTLYYNAENCSDITDIPRAPIPSSLQNLIIGETVKVIPARLFANCENLTSVTIPNSVKTIGKRAFQNNYNVSNWSLTTVILGDSVTTIGDSAFFGCKKLLTINFPASVTTIGHEAFYDCGSLDSVLVEWVENIPEFDSVFDLMGSSPTLHVPCFTTSLYQNSDTWNGFTIQEPDTCDSLQIVTVLTNDSTMGTVTGGGIYVIGNTAVLEAIPNQGYRFDHWSDGNTENPRTMTVTHNTTIIAIFRPFKVVVNNAMCGGEYLSGNTAVVFALPQVDLQFAGWSDGETANPRYIMVTSDTTLTALFRAPDTVRIYDTTTVYDTVINIVYDTTEYNHYYYDTTRVYDTLVVYDTTRVYDTMVYVNIDTVHHYYYDTTRVFDTLVNIDTVNHYFFDTTLVYDTVVYVHVDTLHYYQYDTTYIIDTLVFYDTTSETHYVFDSTWVYDSVWVFDSVYITDTVYFFDTVYIEVPVQGIDGVEMVNVKVYTHLNRITVEGAEGMAVRLYDVNGRLLATKIEDAATTHFYVQASGTYLVRVGDLPARRVVVIM